jgi:hypothetical protein
MQDLHWAHPLKSLMSGRNYLLRVEVSVLLSVQDRLQWMIPLQAW